MKKNHVLTFLFLSVTLSLFAQQNVSGIIYEDINRNGSKDRNEKGLPNVAVSNGVEVVLTNEKGEYTLPVANDNIIFVIKPSGYALPLNEKKLPVFYHIHKPLGSPKELKYAGTVPTGKLPKSLDFALYKNEEHDHFQAFVFGDPQAYNMQEIEYFRKGIIQDIKNTTPISFGISLGDLVGDDLDLHPHYQDAIAALGLPWYNVMGNHDMNYDVVSDSLSDETYEQNFGPNNFSFNYGQAHFIILDNILYPHPETGKGYWGGFREDQLKFIENNLKFVPKDKLIVIAYHIPIIHNDRASKHFRPEDRQRFFDLIANYPNTLSLSAHTHFQEQIFIGTEDGWKREKPHHEYNVGTTSGDWYSGTFNHQGVPNSTMRDGTPKGYAILNVAGNQYTFDYKVAGEPTDYQIKLIGAEKIQEKHTRRYYLYANFFVGTKSDKVQYRINGGDWKNMEYTEEPDPNYVYEVLKYDNSKDFVEGRRPSQAVNSTHLWKVRYPKLAKGTYKIEVRATDMYGKDHVAVKEIAVVE